MFDSSHSVWMNRHGSNILKTSQSSSVIIKGVLTANVKRGLLPSYRHRSLAPYPCPNTHTAVTTKAVQVDKRNEVVYAFEKLSYAGPICKSSRVSQKHALCSMTVTCPMTVGTRLL